MERMRRSRRALFAGVLAVAGLQAYLDIGIDGGRLDWADAEYGTTLRHLEQRKREYPNRPVVVMLGTSRSKTAFAADRLSEAVPGDENPPLVLNASVYSAHPFHFQLVLRRLIAIGAKPDVVFVEIFPLYMSDTSAIYAADQGRVAIPLKATELHRLRGADLDLIWKHDPDRAALWTRRWCESRLAPVSEHRNILIQRYAETWAMPDVAGSPKYWRAAMSPFGWAQPRVRSLPEGAGREPKPLPNKPTVRTRSSRKSTAPTTSCSGISSTFARKSKSRYSGSSSCRKAGRFGLGIRSGPRC